MRGSDVFCVTMLVLAVPLAAAEVTKTPTQFMIPRVDTPVAIDGQLDDWDMNTPYVISVGGNRPQKYLAVTVQNPVKGDADFSGQAALAWDAKHLYVAGRMRDDHLLGVRPDSAGNQGPPGWQCDSLMVRIASLRQPMKGTAPTNPGVPMLMLRYAPMGPNPRGKLIPRKNILDKRDLHWKLTANSQWAVAETPDGYNVEAAIPWADLGYEARPGEPLYIGFLAADVDPGEPLNQVGWGFGKQVKELPLFRLADRADMVGKVTLSLDKWPTDRDLTVRATLDALKGNARLAGVRIVDADGKTVYTKTIHQDVPAGRSAIADVTVRATAVSTPGQYAVQLLAGPLGQAAAPVAWAPVQVIKPGNEESVVQAPAGSLRHPSPARWVWPADVEHERGYFRHGFVTGINGYAPWILKWVEPDLKEGVDYVRKTKYVYDYSWPLAALALAKITKKPEYEKLAVEMMGYLLDTLKKDFRKHDDLYLVAAYRYLTWLKDPHSKFAPPDAEKRYRAVLHQLAANPPEYLFGESGDHNRVWHRYIPLKVARMVADEDGKPIDKRVIEYTDYHDFLLKLGDANDASSNYHWVFWRKAMAYYLHTGDLNAFAKNKGFVRTISRYVEMVSPGGAVPQFGDSGGWNNVSGSLWSYEMAGTALRDGRFRWTSHRIAEYYYNHLYERPDLIHRNFEFARINFILGYLLGDDTVKPTPPPPVSRVTWRHPSVDVPLQKRQSRPGYARHMLDPERWVPDKLILSSGNGAQSLWGIVDLLPTGGHTGELPGNFIVLMAQDAALLAGQGYNDEAASLNNILWIEDLDGATYVAERQATDVPIFSDDPSVTFARIRTKRYRHMPVTYVRDVLFLKNAAVLIKDKATFHSTMKVRMGPCFQTRCLGPQCGRNWFNTYYDEMYSGAVLTGVGPVQSISNPHWDLLVYFADRPHRECSVIDRFAEMPPRCSPVAVRQHWSGMVRAGQTVTFTTVLLPHKPVQHPKELLAPPAGSKQPKLLDMLVDRDDLTAVKLVYNLKLPQYQKPQRRESWLMLNDTGKPAQAGPLASDGRVALVTLDENGRIADSVVLDGKMVRFKNADESARARKLAGAAVVVPKELTE